MAKGVNKLVIIGYVGRDPDVRHTQGGTKVANISVATNTYDPSEPGKERTDWHRVTLWDRKADFAEEHIHKGDRVYVEGELRYDSYMRDGVEIPTAELHAREVVLLTSKEPVS